MKTRTEKIEILNSIVKESKLIDRNIIINKLADSPLWVEKMTQVSITRVKGSPLSTATGKGLHNAIFSNVGTTVVLTIKWNHQETTNHHLSI